ncbi:MAG: NADH-quinone oxidoreductase subunit L, partial [Solirubrobacterales bacterium]
MSATTWGWLVLAFPLGGMLVIALAGRWLPGRAAGVVGTLAIAAAFACAIGAFVSLESHSPGHRQFVSSLYNYAVTAGIDAKLDILIDPLSVFMMLVVSGVSMLIHLYSVAYMASDRGYRRFFAYLNFFVFSMLL